MVHDMTGEFSTVQQEIAQLARTRSPDLMWPIWEGGIPERVRLRELTWEEGKSLAKNIWIFLNWSSHEHFFEHAGANQTSLEVEFWDV